MKLPIFICPVFELGLKKLFQYLLKLLVTLETAIERGALVLKLYSDLNRNADAEKLISFRDILDRQEQAGAKSPHIGLIFIIVLYGFLCQGDLFIRLLTEPHAVQNVAEPQELVEFTPASFRLVIPFEEREITEEPLPANVLVDISAMADVHIRQEIAASGPALGNLEMLMDMTVSDIAPIGLEQAGRAVDFDRVAARNAGEVMLRDQVAVERVMTEILAEVAAQILVRVDP